MGREDVEERLRALAERRNEAEQQLRETEQRLAEVEEEHNELQGALQLRHRQLQDLQEYEERLNDELRHAAVEEARAALDETVERRDTAVRQAADAAAGLRAAVERLDEAREAVAAAEAALRRLDVSAAVTAEPEPVNFEEEWSSVAPLVEQELNERLKMQIVAAAAESVNPLDIESLPEELKLLARARRREILKTRRARQSASD
jgi:chromosome segregation ATPase